MTLCVVDSIRPGATLAGRRVTNRENSRIPGTTWTLDLGTTWTAKAAVPALVARFAVAPSQRTTSRVGQTTHPRSALDQTAPSAPVTKGAEPFFPPSREV